MNSEFCFDYTLNLHAYYVMGILMYGLDTAYLSLFNFPSVRIWGQVSVHVYLFIRGEMIFFAFHIFCQQNVCMLDVICKRSSLLRATYRGNQ